MFDLHTTCVITIPPEVNINCIIAKYATINTEDTDLVLALETSLHLKNCLTLHQLHKWTHSTSRGKYHNSNIRTTTHYFENNGWLIPLYQKSELNLFATYSINGLNAFAKLHLNPWMPPITSNALRAARNHYDTQLSSTMEKRLNRYDSPRYPYYSLYENSLDQMLEDDTLNPMCEIAFNSTLKLSNIHRYLNISVENMLMQNEYQKERDALCESIEQLYPEDLNLYMNPDMFSPECEYPVINHSELTGEFVYHDYHDFVYYNTILAEILEPFVINQNPPTKGDVK
jgi:hypothetical protein